jgi:hypothetical protein
MAVKGVLGEAALQEEVYVPILEGFASGARTVAQLVDDPKIAALGWDRLQQALMILVGAAQLQPALDEAGDADRLTRTKAFNRAVMDQAPASDRWRFLASPVFGGPVFLGRSSQLFLLAREEKVSDPAVFVRDTLMAHGAGLTKEDGTVMTTPEENLAELHRLSELFDGKQLPLLQSLGMA